MDKPLVAIVGRPNVGKSTLFNRIVGRRIAIVEETAGITRDRIYAESDWNGREFVVIDTGGILLNEQDPLRAQVTVQAQVAVEEADVILFMADARDGVTPADEDIADSLRGASKPVLVVANKADNETTEQEASEFYALGLGDVYPISALNGRIVADMLDAVVKALPETGSEPEYPEDAIRLAIVGRPNVGKSSLLNAILGEKRVIVSEIPGTTRDAIDTVFTRGDNTVVLIDTAGIRRSGKIQGSVEYYTVLRAVRAMERADVALIVIDAGEGLLDGDKRVAGFAHDAGRACVVVINKWDMRRGESIPDFADDVRRQIPFIDYAPIVFTSALEATGVGDVLDTALDAAANHAMRIPTGELNRLLQDAVDKHPYGRKGRDLRVKYATMAGVKPPMIVVFVNEPDLVHFSYARYLENEIRRVYSYEGTPLKLIFRTAKKERK
ncbi:MAG: ribosome biogenesis GTPase Der [Armatimonadetes bacterium RBG_16_58_9]|nr:MAG: ribosome biogenesis GTPase Der [Armatimonadetes bacterium RBG_16_58_9]